MNVGLPQPSWDARTSAALSAVSPSSFGRLRVAADDVGENPDGIGKPVGAGGEAESEVLRNPEAVAGNEHHTSRCGSLAERP